MPTIALFGINIAFAVTAWAVVTALYIWPALRARPRIEALRSLLAMRPEMAFLEKLRGCLQEELASVTEKASEVTMGARP